MTRSSELAFCFISGCVAGLLVGAVIYDLSAAAHASERLTCKDEPDRKAYMMRLPGESHSIESCQRVPRYGDPAWIPYMTSPLRGRE